MSNDVVPVEQIAGTILVVRGQKVLLDVDLARLYGVTTGNLNKAVSRNRVRFPTDFMFRLTRAEARNLIFQFGISKGRGGRRALLYAFTEQGVAMLSSVLRRQRAVKVNIAIMRAFVELRAALDANRELARSFDSGERTRLACWRWRPRHRELRLRGRVKFVLARRQNQHARRVRSPSR